MKAVPSWLPHLQPITLPIGQKVEQKRVSQRVHVSKHTPLRRYTRGARVLSSQDFLRGRPSPHAHWFAHCPIFCVQEQPFRFGFCIHCSQPEVLLLRCGPSATGWRPVPPASMSSDLWASCSTRGLESRIDDFLDLNRSTPHIHVPLQNTPLT